jgi:TetR/AcrR family transcriptional repressor of nem operon
LRIKDDCDNLRLLMKYPAEQKAETHEKLVNTAAQSFRQHGSQGEGIASLMRNLGLTHGGFYRHFESKEDLYIQAVTRAFQQAGDRMVAAANKAPKGSELHAIIECYLSLEHLEHAGQGCVIAALAAEIARQAPEVRTRINSALKTYMNRLLPFLPGSSAAEKRRQFFILFPAMAGVMMTARAITDSSARREILATARRFYGTAFAKKRR